MKSGARKSAEPRKHNAQQMVDFAKAMTEAQMRQAAAYYASLPPLAAIKVKETDTVPAMRSQEGMWLPDQSRPREKIGTRVVETPADVDREQLRDPHAGFIVWVLCCDFMRTRVSAVRAGADHEPGGGRRGSRPVTMGGVAAGNLAW